MTREAGVFHHHGIHHGLNEERAKNIDKILDSISVNKKKTRNTKKLNIAALIPIKGDLLEVNDNFLVKKTIDLIKVNHVNEIIVSTDSAYTSKVSKKLGATSIIEDPRDYQRIMLTLKLLSFQLRSMRKIIKN